MKTKNLTGYPSIDKPWLKYYSEEAINAPLPEETLWQYVYENNKDYPNDIAFRYFGTKITYGEFFENVKKAARSFVAMGIGEDDIVTIMSMHTPETIYCLYGINYLGAVANMIYMTLSGQEILDTLKKTNSKLFFVMDTALERMIEVVSQIDIPIIVLSVNDSMPIPLRSFYALKNRIKGDHFLNYRNFIRRFSASAQVSESTDHESPAVIVYTSGTTGSPKGVILSSDNINSVAEQYKISKMHFGRKERYLDFIPIFLAYGLSMLQLALSTGLETILWITPDPEEIAKEFDRIRPHHFASAPMLLEAIMKNVKGDLSNLINFTGGGEEISHEREEEINQFLKQNGAKTYYAAGYGMTECASAVCANMHTICKSGSLGIPLPKANVKIVDIDSGEEMRIGESGEICFNAPNIMIGYYKNPSATAEIVEFSDGQRWLHTGDIGYVDEDGFVFFVGRKKRIYIRKGRDNVMYKFFPQRLEELFESQKYIRTCGVAVKKDKVWQHVPYAFVCLEDNYDEATTVKTQLHLLAERELPEHMRPVDIFIIESMPTTESGKIDYRELEHIVAERNVEL